MDQFGYNPPGVASDIRQKIEQLQNARQTNAQNMYNFNTQRSLDQALGSDNTAQAIMALSQYQQNAPMPGQSSMPQQQPQFQPPMGGTQPPIIPVQSAPIGAPAPAIPQISASQLQTQPQGNPNQGVAANISQMPVPPMPQQIPQGLTPQMVQTLQQPGGVNQIYQAILQEPGGVNQIYQAILQANPNMEPAARSQVVQKLMEAQKSDPYKQMLEMQKLGMGQYAPDPAVVAAAVKQIKSTGNFQVLSRLPAPIREAVLAKLQDFDSGNAQVELTGRKAQAGSEGRQTGQLDVAGEGYAKIMPDALAASAKVPRESWKFANQVTNWLREQSNDPDFAEFQNYNLGLVREYARSMGGTVSAQTKAEVALGTAKNEAAYDRAVKTLYREIQDAARGGQKALAKTSGSIPREDVDLSEGSGIKVNSTNPNGDDFSHLWQ